MRTKTYIPRAKQSTGIPLYLKRYHRECMKIDSYSLPSERFDQWIFYKAFIIRGTTPKIKATVKKRNICIEKDRMGGWGGVGVAIRYMRGRNGSRRTR